MTYLVAAIEHRARVLANTLARKLAERCSGLSDYEAGDYLDAATGDRFTTKGNPEFVSVQMPDGTLHTERLANPPEASFADLERHRSRVGDIYDAVKTLNHQTPLNRGRCPNRGAMCNCTGECLRPKVGDQYCLLCGANITAVSFHACPKTPAAGQRGENPAGGVTPPTPAGSPDPSPTTIQSARQPSVGGEGSPADSDIPPSPAGERPDWLTDLIQSTEGWVTDIHAFKAIEKFDEFVRDHVDPSLHAHFADNDDNAAEYVRRAIREAVAVSFQFSPLIDENDFAAGLGPTPGEFAAVAVREVLADHVPTVDTDRDHTVTAVYCNGSDGIIHDSFDDWFDWREHVAAEVARRIDAAITSQT